MTEMTAKISRRWIKKLLTWSRVKPPTQHRTSTTARMRNMQDLLSGGDRLPAVFNRE
jgi:hypothetical protein